MLNWDICMIKMLLLWSIFKSIKKDIYEVKSIKKQIGVWQSFQTLPQVPDHGAGLTHSCVMGC